MIDFKHITACGECCIGCSKKDKGFCRGCIESDGQCEEWAESGGCPIYKCAQEHSVSFCGLCTDFPCDWLKNRITWNPDAIENLSNLAQLFRKQANSTNK
ncbi:MAG: DUF3795 domain-containing protein [Clostridia bacterium]|nr:DUF3795 domain-containing protein [Clostridia bacterium]